MRFFVRFKATERDEVLSAGLASKQRFGRGEAGIDRRLGVRVQTELLLSFHFGSLFRALRFGGHRGHLGDLRNGLLRLLDRLNLHLYLLGLRLNLRNLYLL